jgi:hypothetical protein
MIHGLSTRFAGSDGRKDDALLPSLQPQSLHAFEPSRARLAGHAHLVPGLAAASTAADTSTGRDAT